MSVPGPGQQAGGKKHDHWLVGVAAGGRDTADGRVTKKRDFI
jgi:hypothetical protein